MATEIMNAKWQVRTDKCITYDVQHLHVPAHAWTFSFSPKHLCQ